MINAYQHLTTASFSVSCMECTTRDSACFRLISSRPGYRKVDETERQDTLDVLRPLNGESLRIKMQRINIPVGQFTLCTSSGASQREEDEEGESESEREREGELDNGWIDDR